MPRAADFDWAKALADPGFLPARSDVEPLLSELTSTDRKHARRAEKALARLGVSVVDEVRARLDSASLTERARLVRLAGRLARAELGGDAAEALRALFVAEAKHDDAGVRRQAFVALGGLGVELELLLASAQSESRPELLRALAAALGKFDDERALPGLESLAARAPADPELTRLVREGTTKLTRIATRGHTDGLDLGARLAGVAVWLHVRRGLEEVLLDELPRALGARIDAPGRIAATLRGEVNSLWSARTMLRFGFPIALSEPVAEPASESALESTIVRALTSSEVARLATSFSARGGLRYRIEWAGGGRRRSLTMRVADAVTRLCPKFVNDPRGADWELVVYESSGAGDARSRRAAAGTRSASVNAAATPNLSGIALELWPRGLADRRFEYRVADLPAASHPTLAAALARVAGLGSQTPADGTSWARGVSAGEVVWDPFVGSGSELVERARLGPATFIGTDIDPTALAAARKNLTAAGVAAELVLSDARRFTPKSPVTLVITNPPMGRRVLGLGELGPLFSELFAHAAKVMAPRGRFVWLSPFPADTERMARENGFVLSYQRRIDMGGFWAELQRFEFEGCR
ncbi:MAG: hypothetical protein EXR75_08025 [Myxococcales bacterium]|nr:hypothetical protein [Myxococcales bacterium]